MKSEAISQKGEDKKTSRIMSSSVVICSLTVTNLLVYGKNGYKRIKRPFDLDFVSVHGTGMNQNGQCTIHQTCVCITHYADFSTWLVHYKITVMPTCRLNGQSRVEICAGEMAGQHRIPCQQKQT